MKRTIFRFVGAFLLATAVVYAPACSSSDSHDHGGGDGVVYEGGTTDEALGKLEGAAPKSDAARAPTFTAPAANAKLPAATPAAFSWKATPTGMLPRRAPERFTFGLPLGGERVAHAHGDPLNGKAYVVTFGSSANAKVLRVFTTKTSYTPDDASWTKLKAVKAPITVSIVSASFDNNNLASDGGPFAGTSVTFTIE